MDTEIGKGRLGVVGAILPHLDPTFMLLPSTVRFPYPAIVNGELGICAIIPHLDVALHDDTSNQWFSAGSSFDPLVVAAEIALDLAMRAKAPADRVTALVWMTKGMIEVPDGLDPQIVLGDDPRAVAVAAQDLMRMRLVGSSEPTVPWLGAYAASAMAPRGRPSPEFRRLLRALEYSLKQAVDEVGAETIVCFGHDVNVAAVVDPRFLLPALAICAYEDWWLAASRRERGTGFKIKAVPDPSALLGYRVEEIEPAIPFTALAPITATFMRCRKGNVLVLDDLIHQFGSWLIKNKLDDSVIDDVDTRLAVSQ